MFKPEVIVYLVAIISFLVGTFISWLGMMLGMSTGETMIVYLLCIIYLSISSVKT
jgi:hypothetical protein